MSPINIIPYRAAFLVLALCANVKAVEPLPTNNNPANQIRFMTPAEADARRSQLVHFIWDGDLPTAKSTATIGVAFPMQADGIDQSHVATVDLLNVDVSEWGFHCMSYLMHPKNTINANRLVVVHQGHSHNLDLGVGTTADHLLQNGFTVLVMKMPLFGWNKDRDINLPIQGATTYHDHNDMVLKTGPKDRGWGIRLFLEPVVQNINYVEAANPNLVDISMVGLSGGGWTTSMMSAVDPRIKLSVPIAGSAPLYHRNADSTPATIGDAEQTYLPLFREDIAADGTGGGVATWLEIYALGGYGQDRRQIQVTNEFDSCCFGGKFPDGYKAIVADKVKQLGEGQWEHFLDSTHQSHVISQHVIAKVINPLFGIANPAPNELEFRLTLKQQIELSIENIGTTVVGRLDGKPVLVTQGYVQLGDERHPALEAVTASGDRMWRHVEDSASGYGEYIQWLDSPGDGEPLVNWVWFPTAKDDKSDGYSGGLVRARDGTLVHRFKDGRPNNPSFLFDVDGDGQPELIYCGREFVSCFDLGLKQTRWRSNNNVAFCWSYPTALHGSDGKAKIIWGSEYNLPGNRSSMVAVDANGQELWRHDGINEDLGSTPLFVADTDGDGTVELVKNGLDLEARNQLEFNHLFIFNTHGELLRAIPSLMHSTGIADLNGDGRLDAFGVVSHRDGGNAARRLKELRCVDLVTGHAHWRVSVQRVGLPTANALAADVTGDGKLEAIIADGNPSFYGHLQGPDWGAIYIVSAKGQMLQIIELPKWPRRMLMCDLDDDGRNELIVQMEGAPASILVYGTQAPCTCRDWPLAFGNIQHWGREHLTVE